MVDPASIRNYIVEIVLSNVLFIDMVMKENWFKDRTKDANCTIDEAQMNSLNSSNIRHLSCLE